MPYNIPLMRRILHQITAHPETFNQGSWTSCVAGWAIRLDGQLALIRQPGAADGVQVIDFRTGRYEDTEKAAARLLGLHPDETAIFGVDNRLARGWLEDLVAAHDRIVLDGLDFDLVSGEWPVGEVQG